MADRFDVVVVGARCAGAPLAALLARRGLRVCLVDRARFPSEVPSTHVIQPPGVATLARLGLLGAIDATGAPPIDRGRFVVDDLTIDFDPESMGRLGAPMYCVRRVTLDQALVHAAAEAGAEVRTQTPVVGLIDHDGVVQGVRTRAGPIAASLVVGADGPASAIARLVGSREYHRTPPGRLFLWGYFEGAAEVDGRIRLGKVGDQGMLAAPTDAGLFMAAVAPSHHQKEHYLADPARGLAEGISHFEDLADLLAGAQRVGPVRTMARWHGYFREATGPGWVLVGDAGHVKDPTPGQGIADALRQVEHLAPAIESGLGDGTVGARLAAWARWRDEDAWEMHWFATDLGAAGPTAAIVVDMIRGITRRPAGVESFLRVLAHDIPPSRLFTGGRAMRSLARLVVAHPRQLALLGSEAATLVREDARRRRRRRHPELVGLPGVGGPVGDKKVA